ncbi:MAG: hypothetical protein MJ171_05925 [Clostridia bacterium]|nr:hypothetical protein [Clostridia bacterium]
MKQKKKNEKKKAKRIRIIKVAAAAVIVLALLFVPVKKTGESGTVSYNAIMYKIVHFDEETMYGHFLMENTYFFPNSLKSAERLFDMELNGMEHEFDAVITEKFGTNVIVAPYERTLEAKYAKFINFALAGLSDEKAEPGDWVHIVYKGNLIPTNPAIINAVSWKKCEHKDYPEYANDNVFIDKEYAFSCDSLPFDIMRIEEIYSNCFFLSATWPAPYEIKINGTLPPFFNVGDYVSVTAENIIEGDDGGLRRVEGDMVTVCREYFTPIDDPLVCYKPVIYLYPTEETDVTVSLDLKGELTCTYPRYDNGWNVKAYPDGTLKDIRGTEYSYLYWEGETAFEPDMSKGFSVKGTDTASFLEDALSKLGLNRKEANEFIVFWLPLMEKNEYNIISFQEEKYTEAAKLNVSPSPDTVIRVFMTYQASDKPVSIEPQMLYSPERQGFTVVEWGGTEIRK